jgi:hypothetical protein
MGRTLAAGARVMMAMATFARRFRIPRLAQFKPEWTIERSLVIGLCVLLGAIPAVATWLATQPVSDDIVIGEIGRLPSPSMSEISSMQWQELLRRASAHDDWRKLDAFLIKRLPVMQPLTGAFFGPLPESAKQDLHSVAGADDATGDERARAEEILKRVAVANRDSLPAQFLIARWYLAHDNPRRAFEVTEDFLKQSQAMKDAAASHPDVSSPADVKPDEQRELLAHSLVRFLACESGILTGLADRAIPQCRAAIGSASGLEQVALEPRASTARAIDLVKADTAAASVIDGEPPAAGTFTTMSLYDALIVAYLQADSFQDTRALWRRELFRAPTERPADDALYGMILKTTAKQTLHVPEHVLWAISNLQRIGVQSDGQMPASHLTFEAAVCSLLTTKEYLGDAGADAALASRAQDRLGRAWSALAADSRPDAALLQPLLAWTSTTFSRGEQVQHLAEIDRTGRAMVAGSGLDKRWSPLAQTARWTQTLHAGDAGNVLSEVAQARAGVGTMGSVFAAASDDRHWLDAWYRALLDGYLVVLRDRVYEQLHADRADAVAADDAMPVFLAATRLTGRSAATLLDAKLTEGERLPFATRVQLLISDHVTLLIAVMVLIGVGIFWAAWFAYVNICRYRALLHGRFYRDEHLWLRQ